MMRKLLENFSNAPGAAKLDILHEIAKRGGMKWVMIAMPMACLHEVEDWLQSNGYRV